MTWAYILESHTYRDGGISLLENKLQLPAHKGIVSCGQVFCGLSL
jgi:hypothetical protein